MKVQRLFQKTLFGIFALFGFIGLSTSVLCVYTVDTHLSEEYVSNSRDIAKTIADASVDILLNRDLAVLQSLIDQFVEIQGIEYVYVTDETGEFLAHTFVPGVPEEILSEDRRRTGTVERSLPGMGDFVEVGSPILAGVVGAVHVGMDTGLIALKIQRAIGQQVYLICIVFVAGVFAALRLVNLAAKPLGDLLGFAAALARSREGREGGESEGRREVGAAGEKLLARDDEVGQLARLFLHLSEAGRPGGPGGGSTPFPSPARSPGAGSVDPAGAAGTPAPHAAGTPAGGHA